MNDWLEEKGNKGPYVQWKPPTQVGDTVYSETPAQEQTMTGYGASSKQARATEENARLGGWQEM